ncbi:MAG: phosphoesterase [Clostridia bacterium]|nr:phosphoesterase [Clostridia bacterium]
MIDIHSHLLYGIDDGASSIENSVKMICEAKKAGINTIFSTVHYHENVFGNERIKEKYKEVVNRAKDFDLDIRLGYEVHINSINSNNISKIMTLRMDHSPYILIEFPCCLFSSEYIKNLKRMQKEGIVPIIAHPERSRYFVKNIDALHRLIEAGCVIQLDAASIAGVYGYSIKRVAKKLLKLNIPSFVASNAHFSDDYSKFYINALYRVRKWTSLDYAEAVFNRNAQHLVDFSQTQKIHSF